MTIIVKKKCQPKFLTKSTEYSSTEVTTFSIGQKWPKVHAVKFSLTNLGMSQVPILSADLPCLRKKQLSNQVQTVNSNKKFMSYWKLWNFSTPMLRIILKYWFWNRRCPSANTIIHSRANLDDIFDVFYQVLNTSKDGDSIASADKLFYCLTTSQIISTPLHCSISAESPLMQLVPTSWPMAAHFQKEVWLPPSNPTLCLQVQLKLSTKIAL